MSEYLEEAAEQLRLALKEAEKRNQGYPSLLTEARERIAGQFAQLAAIEKGLVPEDLGKGWGKAK